MPTIRNITVHVTTTNGTPLREHGIQTFSSNKSMISCFIESKTDMPFHITVQPTMPFPDFPKPDDHTAPDQWDELPTTGVDEFGRSNALKAAWKKNNPRIPFDLLASLYLDGRVRPEKQMIIYLDHKHPNYPWDRAGKAVFRSRYLYDADGKIRNVGWVFQDVGIEDLLGVMRIEDAGSEPVPVNQEEELAQAFGRLGEKGLGEKEEGKRGKIEIVLEKVRVRATKRGAWKPDPSAGKEVGFGASGESLSGVSHKVGRDAPGETVKTVDSVVFEKVGWPPYARFCFMYKSAGQLERLLGVSGVGTGVLGVTERGREAREKLERAVIAGRKTGDASGQEEEGRKGKERKWEKVGVDEEL